jgi:Cd(II)/Pb(II)-responsive transcriptional regulator
MDMRIGELAQASGTSIETIRFYERENLIPAPGRTEGNYRIYTHAHVERLGFIRQCRSLDMALDEVRVLLRFKDAPQEECGEVNALLDEHIVHVAHRIRELRVLEKQLRALRAECVLPQASKDCGILQGIDVAAGQPGKVSSRRHVRGAH